MPPPAAIRLQTMLSEHYVLIKHLHTSSAGLSLGLFFLRGLWMLWSPGWLQRRWVKVLPHVIDTVLLVSAILLTIILSQYPLAQGWLTAKVLALLVYITLGTIALKRGRTRRIRLAAFIGALLTFGYIVGVALTRNPLSWLA